MPAPYTINNPQIANPVNQENEVCYTTTGGGNIQPGARVIAIDNEGPGDAYLWRESQANGGANGIVFAGKSTNIIPVSGLQTLPEYRFEADGNRCVIRVIY